MGNAPSRSSQDNVDFENLPPGAPNPWDELNRPNNDDFFTSSSHNSSSSHKSSSCTSGRSTCAQRKAERRAVREQRRQERAIARAERAERWKTRGGGCGGCCGGKKKKKMLTDMYFESLNNSLGQSGRVGDSNRVEEIDDDEDDAGKDVTGREILFNQNTSIKNGRKRGERGPIVQAGAPSRTELSHDVLAGSERTWEEVPPPAYEEVMDQPKSKNL